MPQTTDTTTLLCLFHHDAAASSALAELKQLGVPPTSIRSIGHQAKSQDLASTLEDLGVPGRDLQHLSEGVKDGGTIVIVSAAAAQVANVERIFGDHRADKIDEAAVAAAPLPLAAPLAAAKSEEGTVIPIVEEELSVGKRTVDRGGVRVFRRVVEMPAEANINLREEHVAIDRHAVNRPATQADLDGQGDRTIELRETAEEAVVSKNAHVVEELVVGKQVGEHTQHIQDTVRRTDVEVEELPGADAPRTTTRNS